MSKDTQTPVVARGEQHLVRRLGLASAIALGVGTTVGSGIFTSVGGVAGTAGTPPADHSGIPDRRLDHDPPEPVLYRTDDCLPRGWPVHRLLP